jgi:hypothetical protein
VRQLKYVACNKVHCYTLEHLALVGQLAALADVRHPQLCVVPGHVGVVVAHPCQLRPHIASADNNCLQDMDAARQAFNTDDRQPQLDLHAAMQHEITFVLSALIRGEV